MVRPRSLFVPVLLCLLAVACRPGEAAEGDTPLQGHQLQRREATRVRVASAERREMLRITSTTTNVESINEIQLFPRISGVITAVQAEEGDRVEEGALLAVIDPRDAEATLADARVALKEAQEAVPRLELSRDEAGERAERAHLAYEQARREVERNEKAGLLSDLDLEKLRLTRDTSIHDWAAAKLSAQASQQELERQATTIERAELAVSRQELALSHTRITAPFTGIVAARSIRVGDSVSSASAAFTLTDPDHLRAVVYRPQREMAFFGNNTNLEDVEIRVEPEALPGHAYGGTIQFLSPTIDAASGSFRITIALEQPSLGDPRPRLAPGMLIRLEIVTERRPNALVVPKRALRREGDTQFLFTVRADKAVRVNAEEGLSDDEHVELILIGDSTLEAGEPVIVVGNRDLEDGEDVHTSAWDADEDELEG